MWDSRWRQRTHFVSAPSYVTRRLKQRQIKDFIAPIRVCSQDFRTQFNSTRTIKRLWLLCIASTSPIASSFEAIWKFYFLMSTSPNGCWQFFNFYPLPLPLFDSNLWDEQFILKLFSPPSKRSQGAEHQLTSHPPPGNWNFIHASFRSSLSLQRQWSRCTNWNCHISPANVEDD